MINQFNTRSLLKYSFIAFPISFASLPVYILAPDFYAKSFGISLATIGVILLLVRVIDAISGPVMGYISDKWADYRTALIIFFCIVFIVGFVLLFVPMSNLPLVSFTLGLTFCALGYSFLLINVTALGALWRHDEKGKVTISSFRESMTLFGVLIATILPTILSQYVSLKFTYVIFSIIFTIILLISAWWFIQWYTSCYKVDKVVSIIVNFKTYLNSFTQDQAYFYAIFIASVLAMSSTIVLVNFFVTDFLGLSSSYLGVFLFLYFLSAIIAIPFWRIISNKVGLMNTWLISMILLTIFFSSGLFLARGDSILYGLICILTGLTLGAELIIPPSILAILIDNKAQSSLASGYYALNDFITKLSLAIASAVLLTLLEYLGFEAGKPNTANTLYDLLYLYILTPCVLKVCAIILLMIWKKKCLKNM